jgi:mannosylglycoprotein endo-beta-mannosidase
VWLQREDCNTKFFHKVASAQKNHKHIWDLRSEEGRKIIGQANLKEEAAKYFKHLGNNEGMINEEQSSVENLYRLMVTEEDTQTLEKPCFLEDIENILKGFTKDKSPGPDGWNVEFFLHYFELVGDDLLGMVEESRHNGDVIKSLNSTFLVLIPKANIPTSFGDYRPISLCNL